MFNNKLKASLFKAIFTVMILIIYKTLFGYYNISIGLIIALSCIAFLKFDFTLCPVYKTLSFIGLSFFLLLMSFLSGLNPFIGFIINIFTIFIVSYIYIDTSKNMVSYLFIFIYIYMISIPVPFNLLPKRFLSLLFGVLTIIISQFLFNKNKFKASCTNMILNSLYSINKEINSIIRDNYTKKDNILIHNSLRNLLLLINDKNLNSAFSKVISNHYFNIAVILERLTVLIDKINLLKNESLKINYLNDLTSVLSNIIKYIETKNLNNDYDIFLKKYSDIQKDYNAIYECNNLVEMLYSNIKTIDNPVNRIKVDLKELILNNISVNVNSLKFNFSIKISLAISLSMFFVDKFNLPNGKWMIITIYVLIQPFISDTVIKTKKRIKGTILGVSLFVLIFGVLHPNIPRVIFMFLILLIYFYATDYYVKVIFTCMLALSINLTGNSLETLSILRLSFILLGSIISILFSRYFLPFTHVNHIDDLKNKYLALSSNMVLELRNLLNGKSTNDNLVKLSLDCNTIESHLLSLSKNLNDPTIKEFINTEYKIISHIRLSTLSFYNNKIKRSLS